MLTDTCNTVDLDAPVSGVYVGRIAQRIELLTRESEHVTPQFDTQFMHESTGAIPIALYGTRNDQSNPGALRNALQLWTQVDRGTAQYLISAALTREFAEATNHLEYSLQQTRDSSVDWNRWHELLDRRARGPLSDLEESEYRNIEKCAKRLDEQEAEASARHAKRFHEHHERVFESLRLIIDAVNAASSADSPESQ